MLWSDCRAYVVMVVCILFNTVGALSAYLIVVGDLVRWMDLLRALIAHPVLHSLTRE